MQRVQKRLPGSLKKFIYLIRRYYGNPSHSKLFNFLYREVKQNKVVKKWFL